MGDSADLVVECAEELGLDFALAVDGDCNLAARLLTAASEEFVLFTANDGESIPFDCFGSVLVIPETYILGSGNDDGSGKAADCNSHVDLLNEMVEAYLEVDDGIFHKCDKTAL